MSFIRNVDELVQRAATRARPAVVACAAPDDGETLRALRMAADAGIARPLAVGRRQVAIAVADTLGISLDGFEFLDVPDQEDAPARAVACVRDGRADILMKGSLQTRDLLRAALDPAAGLRRRMLSHVALFDAPPLGRPVAVTDAAVNIRPDLSQKIEIIRNAAEVVRRLGIDRPRVAVIAAVETVRLPAMPATLDAKLLERMANAGELGDVLVQGPLALDDAVSLDVVRSKELRGPVAGRADILVAPEIETGNVFYKALTCFAGLEVASIVWGAAAPVVVPARADSARVKFLGVALGAALLDEGRP